MVKRPLWAIVERLYVERYNRQKARRIHGNSFRNLGQNQHSGVAKLIRPDSVQHSTEQVAIGVCAKLMMLPEGVHVAVLTVESRDCYVLIGDSVVNVVDVLYLAFEFDLCHVIPLM